MSDEKKVLRVNRKIVVDPKPEGAPPGNYMQQRVTREEMMQGIAEGVLAAAQKMYDQLSQEFSERLEAETRVTVRMVVAHMTWHYSLRGRWTRFLRWLRAPRGGPQLVATPTEMDAPTVDVNPGDPTPTPLSEFPGVDDDEEGMMIDATPKGAHTE